MSDAKSSDLITTDLSAFDGAAVVDGLNKYLRLRTTPIGMKLFESKADMEAIPRIRRPKEIHTTDQIVGQASRNGWTVGITAADLVGAQCSTVIGLHPRSDEWLSGERMTGVWYETKEDAAAHQEAMDVVPFGNYEAMAVSPLASGRLNPPDICLIYATPAQMILFIPCFAERRYGGVMEDELLMAIPPYFLPKIIQGLDALSRNGLRYPIPQYGVNNDVRAGMGVSY